MQKDLFDSEYIPERPKAAQDPGGFLQSMSVTLTYDQLVLILIGAIVYSCVLFGFGVYTGKGVSLSRFVQRIESSWFRARAAAPAVPVKVPDPLPVPAAVSENASAPEGIRVDDPAENAIRVRDQMVSPAPDSSPEEERNESVPSGKYTIQMVAYKQGRIANELKEKLSRQGLQSFVLKGRTYHNVCVNSFLTLSDAQKNLMQLKARGLAPQDAYVRNLA